jgi:hypothetical protein
MALRFMNATCKVIKNRQLFQIARAKKYLVASCLNNPAYYYAASPIMVAPKNNSTGNWW